MEKLAAGVLLLHDNVRVHKSRVAQVAIRECMFNQLNHPSYSPDLASSDFYRNSKSYLCETRFWDGDELNAATEAWFGEQTGDFYFKGIYFLKEKWTKYIEEKQDYTCIGNINYDGKRTLVNKTLSFILLMISTLFILMDYPIHIHTISKDLYLLRFKGSQVYNCIPLCP